MTKDSFAPEARRRLKTLQANTCTEAENAALVELAHNPDCASAWELLGRIYSIKHQFLNARDAFDRAFKSAMPTDCQSVIAWASALSRFDSVAGVEKIASAMPEARSAEDFFQVSLEAERQGAIELAGRAVRRAIQLAPHHSVYSLQLARVEQSFGRSDSAAAIYRAIIQKPRQALDLVVRAWFGLMDLKTVRLNSTELEALQSLFKSVQLATHRSLLGFALGKALEDAGQYVHAYDAFNAANEAARESNPWRADAFDLFARDSFERFKDLPISESRRGSELIFIVGLPRSGTTLVEQILAAHDQVEGAGELPFLPMLIQEESARLGKPYLDWAAVATEADWKRLAQIYLQHTARYRLQKPISTDKLPENWHYLGAIRSMFPAARIVDCQRDPLETAWSCYKQLFAPGRVAFSYKMENLARYWQAHQRTLADWRRVAPTLYVLDYEKLVRDPEVQIRELLKALQLSFDSKCLDPHKAVRSVNTPSSGQVRAPIAVGKKISANYVDLMARFKAEFLVDYC
jgi:tetratricopeptide (TPR) repeat protein